MNHSQLRAFHAVAQEGSFTKAAKALSVSQPTLSGQVKALESHYGITLFRRGGRDVTLTDLGRALFEITRRHFATQSEAQALLAGAGGLVRGRLQVGADSPFSVIPLLATFSGRYPRAQTSVVFGNSDQVMASLMARQIDVAMLPKEKTIAKADAVVVVPVRNDPLVVFVEGGHAWSRRRSVYLSEFSEQTLILREPGSITRAVIEAELKRQDVSPRHVIEIGSREAVKEAVAAGMGIGVVNDSEFGHDQRLHKLSISGCNLRVMECIICCKDHENDPAISAFMEIARTHSELTE